MNSGELTYAKKLRIAAFGFRSIPPQPGCAGADKFAIELFSRLARDGHKVVAYNRLYKGQTKNSGDYQGINLVSFKTVRKSGFDTMLHSFKSSLHILFFNTGDIVHIQNGGNSIWALILRLFGKKVFISQDGVDWKREKWPWYGKLFLSISQYFTAYLPNKVIFDNVFSRDAFENKFNRKYDFIPFGCEVKIQRQENDILQRLNLLSKEYFLFVGRFIPDKGVHYLISAFGKISTSKKLVLVGGAPNPSDYEKEILSAKDERIVFPGYVYGDDAVFLMKHAYIYIQPSDIEGLSPALLSVMYIGTPVICSDIEENKFIVKDDAFTFRKSDVNDLKRTVELALDNYEPFLSKAKKAQIRVKKDYSWDEVARQHVKIFRGQTVEEKRL